MLLNLTFMHHKAIVIQEGASPSCPHALNRTDGRGGKRGKRIGGGRPISLAYDPLVPLLFIESLSQLNPNESYHMGIRSASNFPGILDIRSLSKYPL